MICFLSAETLYLASDGKKSGQMKKINKFYIASLHLEAVFGFHCQVVSLTEELPSAGLPEISLQHLRRQLDAYQAAVTRLDDLLSADTLSPLSKQVIAANKERGHAWRRLNAFAKAMKACPEASVAAAAGRAKAVIDKYGNPTYLPQLQESAILYSLLQELRASLAAGDLEGLGIEVWLDDLEAKENAYSSASKKRLAELSSRQVGAVQQARRSADAAYRNLVEGMNLLATLHGDASFADFISRLNVMVAEEKEVLKGRATRRENKETQEEA